MIPTSISNDLLIQKVKTELIMRRANFFERECLARELTDAINAIEDNYYEKPLSADGTPIDLGTCWYGEDGRKWYVVGYRSGKYDILACDTPHYTHPKPLKSKWLRMERPDSWGLIIDDAISLTDTKKKAELIERCRRLAGERNE